jgi:hypothetical protein
MVGATAPGWPWQRPLSNSNVDPNTNMIFDNPDLWDSLPDSEKTAYIADLYRRVGYSPQQEREERRIAALEQRVAALETELALLHKKLAQVFL